MLILGRYVGQEIIINDNIVITVLGIRGGQIKIGINAPPDVSVNRREIHERIIAEQYNEQQ